MALGKKIDGKKYEVYVSRKAFGNGGAGKPDKPRKPRKPKYPKETQKKLQGMLDGLQDALGDS